LKTIFDIFDLYFQLQMVEVEDIKLHFAAGLVLAHWGELTLSPFFSFPSMWI